MEPTIKTIDTKHVEYFVLHLAGSDLYGSPRPVGRGVGADVPVPEVAAHRSRDVAVSGIEFSAAFPPSGGGVGERRPPRALRHRTQPPGHGRHRRALPRAAQFPLGFQARSLPHPLLRAVPARPRRHLHRQGTCRRGVGAAAPRRRAVVVARGFVAIFPEGTARRTVRSTDSRPGLSRWPKRPVCRSFRSCSTVRSG